MGISAGRRLGVASPSRIDRAIERPAAFARRGPDRSDEVHVRHLERVHTARVQEVHRADDASGQEVVRADADLQGPGKPKSGSK